MSETVKKFKFFLFSDIDKEEDWINEQRKEGLYLVDIPLTSLFYHFRKTDENTVPVTRIDFREFKNRSEYLDYLFLYEDAGWTVVKGSQRNGLQYFRQDNPEEGVELYSDNNSKANLYLRYCKYLAIMFMCFLPILISLELTSPFEIYTFKSAYLTPGLWEMSGLEFVKAFAFETPFAFFRIFGSWLLVILIGSFLVGAIINWLRYKRLKSN